MTRERRKDAQLNVDVALKLLRQLSVEERRLSEAYLADSANLQKLWDLEHQQLRVAVAARGYVEALEALERG